MSKNQEFEKNYWIILPILLTLFFIGLLLPEISPTFALSNQTVLTKLNITNTEPHVFNVTLDQNIVLTPGTTTTDIFCNATIMDREGALPPSMYQVNATFYFTSSGISGSPKNDSRYVVNCTNVTTLSNPSTVLYACNLTLWYFAKNGSWTCNVSAIDNGNLNDTNQNSTTILPLVALNVSDLIDYGTMPVFNISDEKTANITNFGNTQINISVRGWGGQNESMYANISMICDYGNVSLDQQRYNITSGNSWANMINLTGTNTMIPGLIVYSRNDTDLKINTTYWRIRAPSGIAGQCNGTVLFTASNM